VGDLRFPGAAAVNVLYLTAEGSMFPSFVAVTIFCGVITHSVLYAAGYWRGIEVTYKQMFHIHTCVYPGCRKFCGHASLHRSRCFDTYLCDYHRSHAGSFTGLEVCGEVPNEQGI
jgi:hypothetical protein